MWCYVSTDESIYLMVLQDFVVNRGFKDTSKARRNGIKGVDETLGV